MEKDKYTLKREARAKDYTNVEIKYKESLLFLCNEEVDDTIEIIGLINRGELNWDLVFYIDKLKGLVVRRHELVSEIAELKGEDIYI